MAQGKGDEWQQETKYYRESMSGGGMKGPQPGVYKVYPETQHVALPGQGARNHGGGPFWDALARRRSVRKFSDAPLALEDLALLMWSFNGITADFGRYQFRTAPSAGALYPIEMYLCANRVEGIEAGIYHHNVPGGYLEALRLGPHGKTLATACLSQKMCETAAAVFIWTAVAERSRWKYLQRAWRYIYLDAGHVGAHLSLAAEVCGMGCCMIGAFFDDEVNSIIGVDGEGETVVYIAAVGHKAKAE